MADDSKPKANDIIELAHQYFGRMSEAHVEMSRMLDLVNKKFTVFSDLDQEKWKPLRTGTAGSMIHRFAHQVVTDRPIVTYTPRGDGREALRDADIAEMWAQNVIEGMADGGIESPFISCAKWALLGAWVLKGPLFDQNAWPEMPPAKDKEATRSFQIAQANRSPFLIEAVDPRQCVWDDVNPTNPQWTIRRSRIPLWMATKRIPKGLFSNVNNKSSNDLVERLEWWDVHWRMTLLDGQPISYLNEAEDKPVTGAIPNIYGYNPYQVGYGPWSFATGRPEEQMRSMLYFIEDELIEESRIASIKRFAMQLYGLSPFVAADAEKFVEEMSAGPGAVVTAADPKDLTKSAPRPMEMPTPPSWLENYELSNSGRIGSNSATTSLLGERQIGTTSALQEGVLMGEGRVQFEPITRQLERHTNKLLNRAAWISEHLIGEPQTIWNERARGRDLTTIKPDVWNGQYHYRTSLEPLDPTRDDRRAMLGLNLFSQSAISPWTLLEDYLKIPNANGELKLIMLWRTINSPEYQALLSQQAAQENEVEDAIAELLGGGSDGPTPGNVGDTARFDGAVGAGIPDDNAEPNFAPGGRGSLDDGSTGIGQLGGRGNRLDGQGNF